MQMVDGMCQRWGQHPDAILHGDSYAFRMVNTLGAYDLLSGQRDPAAAPVPEFPSYDDDPEGMARFTETLG